MTIPYSALEVMKLRLSPSAYQQAARLAKMFFGETAVAAGWVDEIVLPDMVLSRAEEAARGFVDAQAARPSWNEATHSGRRAGGHSRRNRQHGSRIRNSSP